MDPPATPTATAKQLWCLFLLTAISLSPSLSKGFYDINSTIDTTVLRQGATEVKLLKPYENKIRKKITTPTSVIIKKKEVLNILHLVTEVGKSC